VAYPRFSVAIVVVFPNESAVWLQVGHNMDPHLDHIGKHLVSGMSFVTPLEDHMLLIENGNGNTSIIPRVRHIQKIRLIPDYLSSAHPSGKVFAL